MKTEILINDLGGTLHLFDGAKADPLVTVMSYVVTEPGNERPVVYKNELLAWCKAVAAHLEAQGVEPYYDDLEAPQRVLKRLQ